MPQVAIERTGAIAICRLDPPDGFMNEATVTELDRATAELAADAAVRAVVFTGAQPGVFIRHYDVRELERLGRSLRKRGARFGRERPLKDRPIDVVLRRLGEMPKPAIAAINGFAMGGGFEFCLACDLRIAQEGDYELGLPEIKLGILPGAGGTQRLARLVGPARALELALRGRTVSPAEAAALGLVHETAPDALARALAVAGEIAEKPPLAVAHIKALIRHDSARPLEEGLALERTLFLDLLTRDEALERMEAMNAGGLDIRAVKRPDGP